MTIDQSWKPIMASLPGHFICPECGGTYFGSELLSDGSMMRHCHGSKTGYGCGFSWHESKDGDYFYVQYRTVERMLSINRHEL